MMLNKSLSYKKLLRIIGMLLFIYGIYLLVSALTGQSEVSGSAQYKGPTIFWEPGEVLTYIFFGGLLLSNSILPHLNIQIFPWPYVVLPGPLFPIGLSLLLFGLASARERVAYWSLQSALWLISMSLWRSLSSLFAQSEGSFFSITLLLSFVLLVLYRPVTNVLRKFYVSNAPVLAPQ